MQEISPCKQCGCLGVNVSGHCYCNIDCRSDIVPSPAPFVADPALILERVPGPSEIWKKLLDSLRQEKDKWK